MEKSITDFSKTERILLLIDLSPLLYLQNPNLYISPLLKSTQILFSHLSSISSSCLSSFKFFFSSLSPILSTSKLPTNFSHSLSFDRPSNTLRSLSTTLSSLPNQISSSESDSGSSPASSRGSNIASALRQILRDYAWDYQLEEDFCSVGEVSCNAVTNPSFVTSNLIVLFSPFGELLGCLSEFVGLDSNDENLVNPDVFYEMLRGIFGNVNNAFISKDIHLSWVDVKFETGGNEEKFGVEESNMKLGFLEKGVKSLGWGFCSTESIIWGFSIVPFGLIYPLIGVSPNRYRGRDNFKELIVQLNLQISDVKGNPIECRCCDLNLVDLKMLPANRCDDVLQGYDDQRKTFWDRFGDGVTKFFIKTVQRYDEPMKVEGGLLDIVLVNGFSEKSGKERKLKSKDEEFFADTVLKKLLLEIGGCSQSTSQPIWPIVLSYLYTEGYCGIVSLTNENGDSCEGILKPFTAHSALLFLVDEKLNPQQKNYLQCEMNSTSNYVMREEDGIKKNKKSSHFYKDLTWHIFCSMTSEQLNLNLDLGGIYFSRDCTNSKKLKFLKCWMNQMKKSKYNGVYIPNRLSPNDDTLKEKEQRLTESQPENVLAISVSASAGEDALTEASRVQDEAALDTCSGTLDVFFDNLSKRINNALESDGVDLAALAERLVSSAIYWLCQKYEKDTCSGMLADELMALLLREPKELGKRKKKSDSSSVASDPRTTTIVSKTTTREYELQILFRMEILRSEISMSIEESIKQIFFKQICVLLEKIQCHNDGGFFGDWCLDNYVDKTIKNRYSHTLEDVVNKIYEKMDLLPFADEDDSANPLLNSEDSNHSSKDRREKEATGENDISYDIVKADEFFQGIEEEEHACKLIEAQTRRERARRFASFTSWAPDLRRVWAPKQMKPVIDSSSQHKISNKKRRRVNNFDSVCETPMTKNDHSVEKTCSDRIKSCKPVSKVLFQD